MRRLVALVLPCAMLGGCTFDGTRADPGDGVGDDDPGDLGGGDDGDPGDADDLGTFELTSQVDLSTTTGRPSAHGVALATLNGLDDDPGPTIVALLEEAGVVSLPGFLEFGLAADIEATLEATVVADGVSGATEMATWSSAIAAGLTRFELVSQMSIASPAGGPWTATHGLVALRLPIRDAVQTVATPALIDPLPDATGVPCQVDRAAGDLTIDEHPLELPLGELAVVGIDQALVAGLAVADLTAAFDRWIDCDFYGERVSDRCNGPLCPSRAEATENCETGVDALGPTLAARIAAIDFTAMHLAGHGALAAGEADADGVEIASIQEGTWQAGFDLGGTVMLDATFTGQRLAE